jgi:hypothetical protein
MLRDLQEDGNGWIFVWSPYELNWLEERRA